MLRNRPRAALRLSTLLAAALVFAATAEGKEQRGHVDDEISALIAAHSKGEHRVIVRTRADVDPILRQSIKAHGGKVLATHGLIHAFSAVVQDRDLPRLAAQDGVLSISSDAVVSSAGQATPARSVAARPSHVATLPSAGGSGVSPATLRQTLGVAGRWTGKGVGVAVIDSGLEMSSEFEGRVSTLVDFTGGRSAVLPPSDPYGHGTHVAGTIGGAGTLSKNLVNHGIAPKVRFVVLRVLDANGAGYSSDVLRAIDFAVENRTRLGIDIINLSLGHPILESAGTDPLVQAVERASRAGIVVVAAAGNYGVNQTTGLPGYAGISSPGNAPSAITVGAVRSGTTASRRDDRIPDYSSSGPTWFDAFVKPDVLAPGHNIVATAAKHSRLYAAYPHLRDADADYMRLSGTSMATAVASGVVALQLEAHAHEAPKRAPALTPNMVKGMLEFSAFEVNDDTGTPYDVLRQGAGALNAAGAIDLAMAIDTGAAVGETWLKPFPSLATTIAGDTLVWKQAVIWGNSIGEGNTLPLNQTAWGANITWGSNILWSSQIIWSSNIIWSSAVVWSSNIIWAESITWADAIVWGSADASAAASGEGVTR